MILYCCKTTLMNPIMFVVDVKVGFLMELLSVSTAELYYIRRKMASNV